MWALIVLILLLWLLGFGTATAGSLVHVLLVVALVLLIAELVGGWRRGA